MGDRICGNVVGEVGIASILTEENIVRNAVDAIAYRSGYFIKKHSYYDTLALNFGVCNWKIILLVFLCLVVGIVLFRIKRHVRVNRSLFPVIGIREFVDKTV